ncbi:hypothetical protein ABIB51_004559 [Arthrobacter sp. UYCu712]
MGQGNRKYQSTVRDQRHLTWHNSSPVADFQLLEAVRWGIRLRARIERPGRSATPYGRYLCCMVLNVHEREIVASLKDVGTLIDSLASKSDLLWPRKEWPSMRLDQPLGVGAAGGHGPVRYFVASYEPGRRVEFQFTGPAGFHGNHAFTAIRLTEQLTMLRHELALSPRGPAMFTWPIFFRPLHDALIEECLDRAEYECDARSDFPSRRSMWTRILRASLSVPMGRRGTAR